MTAPAPHPLSLTAAPFAAAYAHLKGDTRALYRDLFRQGAATGLSIDLPPIVRQLRSESPEGEVIKFVLDLGGTPLRGLSLGDASAPGTARDNATGTHASERRATSESVLIPMIGRGGIRTYTLCVSSQVGCAMGCTFCETAQMGLIRSLEPHEIVAQWFTAAHVLGIRPKNIVFMGMGEPLDNFDNVIQAIAVLTDHLGAHVAMNKITVSTVGRIDGMKKLAAQIHQPGWHRLNLAVSVNAPNDRIRSQIMPINRAMPMAELREVLLDWPKYGGAKICIEYVLIPGVNDAPEHARELAEYVAPLPACVNLIPYNPRRDSPWPAPDEADVTRFMEWLAAAGAYVKRRRTKGRDMMGACGQLGNPEIRKRKHTPLTVSSAE
ncbi:MAG: 23S rRNA (adenine(2503)-C(2))-methyltransferase RlmN [Phycisphaeraceae bacterium]|nr:23S rRNA (adenine(2503)-C(2))-methyltransferase RlmN [Phycisphaeraceae bacterium]